MAYSEPVNLKHLGACSAIGSGGDYMRKECVEAESSFDKWDPNTPAPQKAMLFAHAINSKRLGDELIGQAGPDWGGYIEYAFFDPVNERWNRGPRSLNLFMYCKDIGDNSFTFHLIGRAIAYDPGSPVGRILSLNARPDFIELGDFILEEI
jgi:hypothetical protein